MRCVSSFYSASFTEVWPTAAIELSGVADTAQREDCTIAHRIVKMAAVIENAGLRLKPLFEGKNLSRSKYMCFAMSIAQIFPAELSSSVSIHPPLVGGNVSRGSRRSEMPRLPLRNGRATSVRSRHIWS